MEERHCRYCGKKLLGRIDKKYCDDSCRNAYNNALNSDSNNEVRNINNTLRKNRRILAGLIPEEAQVKKVQMTALMKLGFNFKYFTHLIKNKQQQQYHFVYDYGYLELEDGWYLVVKSK